MEISWTDRVRYEVLHEVEDRNILSSSISQYFVAPNIIISKNTKYILDKQTNTHVHKLCVHTLRCELASVALSPKQVHLANIKNSEAS
jgi:hypothetical protein